LSQVRPARWPWVVLGVFFALAIGGLIGVAVNGESLAGQIPYVIAFTLFGIVGALLLSRLPGNRVGGLLLFGAAVTAASFAAGELMTYLVGEGITDGPAVVATGLVSSLGWLVGIFPVILFLPQLFPDGHLPSRRWLPFAWLCVAVLAFLGVSLLFGQDTLTGSSEDAVIANPFFISGLGGLDIPTRCSPSRSSECSWAASSLWYSGSVGRAASSDSRSSGSRSRSPSLRARSSCRRSPRRSG